MKKISLSVLILLLAACGQDTGQKATTAEPAKPADSTSATATPAPATTPATTTPATPAPAEAPATAPAQPIDKAKEVQGTVDNAAKVEGDKAADKK